MSKTRLPRQPFGPPRNDENGFTLVELTITLLLFSVMMGAAIVVFNSLLLSWSSSGARTGAELQTERAMDDMVRILREATQILDGPDAATHRDEIRYVSGGTATLFYLYNAADSYPNAFNQTSYALYQETLTGGIGGTFTYGSGTLLLTDVLPPTTSDLSVSSNLATIDLSVTRGDDTVHFRTQVRIRNA